MDFDGFDAGGGVPAPQGDRRRWLRYSKAVAEAVIEQTRAGKVLRQVCAAPGMPSVRVVVEWTRKRPAFAAALRTAREAAGLGLRGGARSSYCAETAEAICARLCAGEATVSILRDPAMPGYSTFYKWMAEVDEFREAVGLAREIHGLRLAEIGWEEACAATPETANLTRVRLEHLRWYAAKLSPKKYGAPRQMEGGAGDEDERLAHQPMTVIVKRFSDVTPQDEAEHDATERLFERRAQRRLR